ncbi:2Fe-2S iron-sulfur cluster binding domain-containing protein [Litorivicinus lipolyticus]|uniref:2Fe-2S iron-sulfur cluster binding domain-containing protein n=1 Tax=Litorivicinus lipolyticus TaxID=418701 RepID=A0A5Q2Q8N8_9GAMM|nr:2Fe-2S iron-sulfur cluster-binding protein [Litorivicinus lipolyticus]QGG79453.1 2Fe-2S iron-sulfur cluster binding domain-containing protein [Litorivicinus lipolyticus]
MPTVKFEYGDETFEVTAEIGESVMMAAARNRVPGIDADCGGGCSCATCHVYAPDGAALPAPSDMEKDMLDFADALTDASRLSCQIVVTPSMDGVTYVIPKL